MKDDGYRLARRVSGKRVVDSVAPELHAESANGWIRDCLREPGQFEVQSSEGIVGIAGRWRDESSDEECFVVTLAE